MSLVPIDTMPSWIQGVAGHQPVTPVVETLRSRLLGTPAGSHPWEAVAWCGGILVASVALSAVLFRRRTG
jgi:ABC-2 type transport system permease protein